MKSKNFQFNIILAICALVVSLITGEFFLKRLGYQSYAEAMRAADVQANSFQELIDTGVIPGRLGVLKPDPDLGYTYYTSPHGFMDEKNFYDDYSAFTRILVLGDSFAEGYSARRGQGFVDLLRYHFRNRKVLFFNTALGGYGQNNQLAVLKKYEPVIKPHAVLLAFYPGNDFYDNLTPMERFTGFQTNWVENYDVRFSRAAVSVRPRTTEEIFKLYKLSLDQENPPRYLFGLTRGSASNVLWQTRTGTLCAVLMDKVYFELKEWFGMGEEWPGGIKYSNRGENPKLTHTRAYVQQIAAYLSERDIPLRVLLIPDNNASKKRLVKSSEYRMAFEMFDEFSLPVIDVFGLFTIDDYTAGRHWNGSGHFKAYTALIGPVEELLSRFNGLSSL